MKKLITIGTVMMMTGVAQAALVFTEDFSGSYSATTGATSFDGTTIAPEAWFGSSNNVGVNIGDSGILSLNNSTANRTRGSAVWLDPSGWDTGVVTVKFDVSRFVAGTGGGIIFGQAYSATGVDVSNPVSMDLHGSAGAGIGTGASGGASITTLGSQYTITGDGEHSFTFNYTGDEQYVALAFSHYTPVSDATATVGNIDNLTVDTIPEPSSALLIGLGFAGLLIRRRA